MKKGLNYFLTLLILIPVSAFAQKQIKVEQVSADMSKGQNTGYEVMIPEVTIKGIKSDLHKYLRKDGRGKLGDDKGETFIIGAVDKNISPDPFNVYVKLRETDEGVVMTAFFTPNDTVFFSSSDQADAIKKYLKDFALKEYKEEITSQVESQKKKQKEMEDQLENLVKAKQKSERIINESKRTIETNNHENESSEKQIDAKQEEIIKQKGIVSTLKGTGSDEEKLADKNLKNLESEKRKLEKDKENLAKENDKMNVRIEDEQRAIENNLKLQGEKIRDIETQKEKVKTVEEKLNSIF